MRILHVHSGNTFGGVERILIALNGHKKYSQNYEHVFALCFPGRLTDELSKNGADVFLLPGFRLSRPWEIARTRASLRKLLSKIKFDLAIVHSAWSHVAFASVIQSAGLPLLFWLHTKATSSILETFAQLNFPSRVLSVSGIVNESAPLLFPSVPSDVVYSPLALDEAAFASANRTEMRASLAIATDDVFILQASRLEPWKGHVQLIEALHQLRDLPNWTCRIAGSGDPEYETHLKAVAAPLGNRVLFLGQRGDIAHLLTAADIYCQPNLEGEGFSIALMEAAFAGLPIVTSAIGGALEIVNSQTGFLIPPGDTQSLAQVLRSLIESKTLREELGKIARKQVQEQCNPEKQFRQLEAVFLKTAQSNV